MVYTNLKEERTFKYHVLLIETYAYMYWEHLRIPAYIKSD